MKGNFHVRFLGEGVTATSPPYPTLRFHGLPGRGCAPRLARFGRRFRRRPARARRSRGAARRNFSGAPTGANGPAARRPFQRPRRDRPQNARRRALVPASGTPPFAQVPPRPGEPSWPGASSHHLHRGLKTRLGVPCESPRPSPREIPAHSQPHGKCPDAYQGSSCGM